MTGSGAPDDASRVTSFSRAGLRFDVSDTGPLEGPPVVALHGFPADRSCWDAVTERLVAAGYRVVAPDQRGTSPSATPAGVAPYALGELAADVVALIDIVGSRPVRLVGHDWGAAVAWHVAATAPERLCALDVLSVPHPAAMAKAVRSSTQALRSWYMLAFQVPRLPEWALGSRGGSGFERSLVRSGLGRATAQRYARRAAEGRLSGAISWYRAIRLSPHTGKVGVPTMLMWGPRDRFLGRAAIALTPRSVVGPYQPVEVPGAGHWLPEEHPDAVADALLAHWESVGATGEGDR